MSVSRYVAKVEVEEADREVTSESEALLLPGGDRGEQWFGRWLTLLATTCPGPITEACQGTSLDLDILPRRGGRKDGA